MRKSAYIEVDPIMGHDLSFPFNLVKRGHRAVYVPEARATEKMVPSIEGEWARKRRMMSHGWPIVVKGGLADPRGYPPLYALMIVSHRLLRYGTPFLHVLTALATLALLQARPRLPARGRRAGSRCSPPRSRPAGARPLLIARYYVLTTAALAAGLYDWLRHGTPGRLGSAGGHAMNRYVHSRRKRALDLAVAGAHARRSARRSSPLAALAVRLESHGHPIYRQRRVGLDGHAFEVYKLRTMVSGAEHMGAGMAVDEGDSRITQDRRAPAADEHRRAAEPGQRAARARCRWSGRGRRSRSRSTSTPTVSGGGSTSGPA